MTLFGAVSTYLSALLPAQGGKARRLPHGGKGRRGVCLRRWRREEDLLVGCGRHLALWWLCTSEPWTATAGIARTGLRSRTSLPARTATARWSQVVCVCEAFVRRRGGKAP